MSQKLKNADLKSNPKASVSNLISLRADACKCGATKCNYSVTVTSPVTAIFLGAEFSGSELDLPKASYSVTSIGAAALQNDLRTLLLGLADNVEVQFNSASTPDELIITIKGSIVVLATVSETDFDFNNCSGTGI